MFGDSMNIECSEEKILLSSNSQDQGKMIVEIKIEDLTSFIIDENETLNLSFSLNYLHNILDFILLSHDVVNYIYVTYIFAYTRFFHS